MESIAILHEGVADKALICQLLAHLQLDIKSVAFYCMGRKSMYLKPEHPNYILLKKRVENEDFKKLLFIIDADDISHDVLYNGYENTKSKLNQLIKQLQIETISDVYIMCAPNTQTGYLESFLLATIPKEQQQCITDFLNCSEFPKHQTS